MLFFINLHVLFIYRQKQITEINAVFAFPGFRGNRRRRDIERLNLDKFQPKRGYTEVHLPPSPSPNVGTSLTGMHNVYSIK